MSSDFNFIDRSMGGRNPLENFHIVEAHNKKTGKTTYYLYNTSHPEELKKSVEKSRVVVDRIFENQETLLFLQKLAGKGEIPRKFLHIVENGASSPHAPKDHKKKDQNLHVHFASDTKPIKPDSDYSPLGKKSEKKPTPASDYSPLGKKPTSTSKVFSFEKELDKTFPFNDYSPLRKANITKAHERSSSLEKDEEMKQRLRASAKAKFSKVIDVVKKIGRGAFVIEKHRKKTPLILSDAYLHEPRFYNREAPILRLWQHSKENLTFDEWLQKHPEFKPDEKKMHYLSEQERKACLVEPKNGKLMNQGKPLVTTESYPFVIGPDNQLYSRPYEDEVVHHSSFFSGGAVMGAGLLMTDAEGRLLEIVNFSGHYKPSTDVFLQTLSLLKEHGYDLSQAKVITLSGEGFLSFPNAEEFLEKKAQTKPSSFRINGITYSLSIT